MSLTNNNDEDFVVKSPLFYRLDFQILACSISGILSALCVTPLDVIKTRIQSRSLLTDPTDFKTNYTGIFDAIRKIYHGEGILALWRGLGFSVFMTVPSTTIYFIVYGHVKTTIEPHFQEGNEVFLVPIISGSTARVAATMLTSPIDLLRTNLQSHTRKVSMYKLVCNVCKSGKWELFLFGLKPTLFRDVPFSAIYWSSYEFLNRNYLPHSVKNSFLAGAISGTIASLMTVPFDVVKTRSQMNFDKLVSENCQSTKQKGVFMTMKEIVKNEGVRSLFKGATPRAVRVAPACAITISTYEWCKDLFSLQNNLPTK